MPLRLDIKRKLIAHSDRVNCVDLHPTEPRMLCSLYSGIVNVFNLENQQLLKTFEVCDLPVRAAKFVPRKNWIITGSDDMQLRVFNYNTLAKVHKFEAHSNYLRCIVIHPTQPFVLTSSDDTFIKLWNWDKAWACQQVFEEHSHCVMQIAINPKDNNTFASASLDKTLKVWQLGSPTANFTLEGHEKGVNCVDYYHSGDKPYLISGADDRLVKIWDYQNKTCVQTLEGHGDNVTAVCFNPDVPVVLTGSEDGTVKVWHANTHRLESSLDYGFERVWAINCLKGSNNVAIGYDAGNIMVKVGREEPAVSMDFNGGKIIWARHCELQQANFKALPEGAEVRDGERLPVAVKNMGACQIYPQSIQHNPNGEFVVVCGDGEYIIYTAMALRNKAFGSAQEFVWAQDSSQYAIRESDSTIRIFKNFKEKKQFKPESSTDGIFGGYFLGVKTVAGLCLYDWDSLELVGRLKFQPQAVYWADNGKLLCLADEDSYHILFFDADEVQEARKNNKVSADGVEFAFEVLREIDETVRTGLWVGICFIYTNAENRINYLVGSELVTIAHLDRPLYVLGYVPKDDRLYLVDKELGVVSYLLLLSVLEYQSAVMRRDFATADQLLPSVPKEHRTRMAYFLEKQGFKQRALAISTDPEHKFKLAINLKDLNTARALAIEANNPQKWSKLGELAASKNNLQLAQECMQKTQNYGDSLLLTTTSAHKYLAQATQREEKFNLSFLSYLLDGDFEKCLNTLIENGLLLEAIFFARSYLPDKILEVVDVCKKMAQTNEKAAQSLVDPKQYENLFPGPVDAITAQATTVIPNYERNIIAECQSSDLGLTASSSTFKAFVVPSELQTQSRPSALLLSDDEDLD